MCVSGASEELHAVAQGCTGEIKTVIKLTNFPQEEDALKSRDFGCHELFCNWDPFNISNELC